MKRLHTIVLLVALALFSLGATPSFAEVKQPMQTHPGPGDLSGECTANGGSFYDDTADGGAYGCDKFNCDGKGGTCSVSCGSASCTATTPGRLVGNLSFVHLFDAVHTPLPPLDDGAGHATAHGYGVPPLPTHPKHAGEIVPTGTFGPSL